MKDLNYFPLDVESNIYCMTTLEFDDKTSKVLVATSNCQIYCINYTKFKPQTREVEFTYIPNGAKIMSIGALKRGANDFVIGITHSLAANPQKSSTRTSTSMPSREVTDYNRLTTYYLNIYASGSMSPTFDLDYVAQGCQTIRLRYVPYHLFDTELISFADESTKAIRTKPFWLLSGGDNCIHAFGEDRPYQSFNEVPIQDCFPELANVTGIALWIDLVNESCEADSRHERAIALGLEDGSIRLYTSILSPTTNKFELVRESIFDQYTTIIPSVRLFKVKSGYRSNLRYKLKERQLIGSELDHLGEQLNLLSVSSTSPSLVFRDVLRMGLDSKFELDESKRLDCAVTSAVGDTNLDGYNELLIGTHGREVLTYQYDAGTDSYILAQTTELNHPIFAISILDLTGDALREVTILLASGVLVLQAVMKDVIEICKSRVDVLLAALSG